MTVSYYRSTTIKIDKHNAVLFRKGWSHNSFLLPKFYPRANYIYNIFICLNFVLHLLVNISQSLQNIVRVRRLSVFSRLNLVLSVEYATSLTSQQINFVGNFEVLR